MSRIIGFMSSIWQLFKSFFGEYAEKSHYVVLNVFTCQRTGVQRAEIKLVGRHIIVKNIAEIVADLNFLDGFDKQTIRALTYMATVEKLTPEYTVISHRIGQNADDCMLEIRSKKNDREIAIKSPIEISKNRAMISKFSSTDANRIGYLAGVKETVKEFNLEQSLGGLS